MVWFQPPFSAWFLSTPWPEPPAPDALATSCHRVSAPHSFLLGPVLLSVQTHSDTRPGTSGVLPSSAQRSARHRRAEWCTCLGGSAGQDP